MAAVCTACNTENRDAAKFCRGCGARLGGEEAGAQNPASWAQTQPAEIADERTLLVAPAAKVASRAAPAPDRPFVAAVTAAPSPQSRAPLAVAALLIALLLGGLLWWWLGARDSGPSAPLAAPPVASPPAAPPPPVVLEAPPPADVPALSSLPSVPVAVPADATVVVEPAAPAPPPAAAPAAAPRPRPTRNAPPTPAVPEPAPAPVAPAQAPVVVVPPPAAPPSPDQACASLGFIARARCMAAECAKPSQTRHPQCVAVRQQQQLEERIRNPEGGA